MSTEKKPAKSAKEPTYRIPSDAPWANAWKITALLGALGLGAALVGYSGDPKRFAFAWLFAFLTFIALGLGGLFFVLGQHLTGAAWGVTSRRIGEALLAGLPVFLILFVPIAMHMDELYPWMHHQPGHDEAHAASGEALIGASTAQAQGGDGHGDAHAADDHHHTAEHAAHGDLIEEKAAYLNPGFFLGRAVLYFAIWGFLAWLFISSSLRQDKEKGFAMTKKMQRWAPASTFLFGFTLTFAAFDWLMSLEPTWYSTIFGVQYFSVAVVSSFAVIILLGLAFRRAGLTGEAINVEHFHDHGKLLFGFLVFWAYISFSQFMLIWYAGIPEEATYYHLRWHGGGNFKLLSLLMLFAHFIVPFFVLISRNTKRRLGILAFGAAWLVFMHALELYWLVMPYAEQTDVIVTTMRVSWVDVACLFAVGGAYLSVVFFFLTRVPLIPVGDPRLSRSLHFENA